MLKKRFVIETIFGYLKERFNIHPARYRSPIKFSTSLVASLIAYQIKPSKPQIPYPYLRYKCDGMNYNSAEQN
jgi:hypothetical protein